MSEVSGADGLKDPADGRTIFATRGDATSSPKTGRDTRES